MTIPGSALPSGPPGPSSWLLSRSPIFSLPLRPSLSRAAGKISGQKQLRSRPALLKRLPPALSSSCADPTYPAPWPPGSLLSWPITAVAWLQPSSFTSSPSTRLHVGHTGLGPIHLLCDLWKPLTPDFGFCITVMSGLFGANGRRWSRRDITGRSIALDSGGAGFEPRLFCLAAV